jgi:adenosine deaminase
MTGGQGRGARRDVSRMAVSESYVQSLPKAELHLHLEGSVGPEQLHALARKYGTEFASLSISELTGKLCRYRSLHEFLGSFKVVCQHLRSKEDYGIVLEDLAESLLGQGVFYVEITYAPSIPWIWGLDGREILQHLLKIASRFEEKGLVIRWVLDCVRQFGVEAAWRTARLAVEHRSGGVVALGMGGDELSLPLAEYREVFLWVKAHEVYAHVHAGEIGGPDQVWSALKDLGANRIGHGVQAARDPRLIEYLREHAVGLDVCLTSNLRTRAWAPLSQHPFPLLYRRGVPVTLNTDDPGLFQTSLTEEYLKAARVFGLTARDLQRIALQAVRCSFLPHDAKMGQMQRLQDQMAPVDGPHGRHRL